MNRTIRALALGVCAMLLLALLAGAALAAEQPFADVREQDYFYDAVCWALRHAPPITAGTSQTSFSPDDVCTRAQAVTFLWRAMGCPETAQAPTGAEPFSDVGAQSWYHEAVLWAVAQGITQGTGQGRFSPALGCTRAELVTFLHRAVGAPAVTGGAQFEDVRADDYFAAAVAWAAANGVTQGADETHFAPDGRCTRAQMVSFLYRARSLFDALLSGPDELPLAVPRIYISTRAGNGTALQKEDDYVNAVITVTDVDGSRQTAPIRVKVRGHSTAHTWVEKKAYTFKYDKKQSLLDLGKGKKWALLANTFDPTLLRNDMANAIARELGLAHTSNHRYVELWMDGSFRGCYDLFEPVQVNKEHVNLDLEGNDGKKDFMLELEVSRMEAGVRYLTAGGIRFAITEPEDATGEQSRYIRQTMETVFDALRTGDETAIRRVIDVPSFVRYYLLNEFLKTHDFNFSSVYFYCKDGLLYAGPAWDYDLAAGNSNPNLDEHGAQTASPEGLYANGCNLYVYLADLPWFRAQVKALYLAHAEFFASLGADGGFLDAERETYAPVFARNYAEAGWSIKTWYVAGQKKPLATYEENFDYLKDWCARRCSYLDALFAAE